ncbi:MAG: hypothetical protein NWF13_04255 [Candidatus Bathyarchaeota archaeon]|nr:hypothetical protein [Candidatus Bathyarchaeota archaeon]
MTQFENPVNCKKCGNPMEFIHGDINSCALYYCETCNLVYRYCAEYESLEQVCPCPPKPQKRLSELKTINAKPARVSY